MTESVSHPLEEANARTVLAMPPEMTVTNKYCIWAISKLWGDVKNRFGLEDVYNGLSVAPPWNSETRVAIVIKGKESVEEELPPNTLTKEQFVDQYRQWMEILRELNQIKNSIDNQAF